MLPQTYMNLSGQAVAKALRDTKLGPQQLWVGHDELDLPLCRMRIRRGGSGAGHNGVLSFAGSGNHIGDVAISWPAAMRQAAQHGHEARTEVALLCVHGTLHLLGWDHVSASERREMTRLTRAALKLSGLKLAPGRL